jgi:hypothetical protein
VSRGRRPWSRRRRLGAGVLTAVCLALAGLAVTAADDGLTYYRTPTETAGDRAPGDLVRVGGLVVPGSVLESSRLRPLDADITYLQGFALARSGSEADAAAVLEHTLVTAPDHAPSLLLLGTMRWRAGDERGVSVLERFLTLDPDHPAAEQVRALLASGAGGSPAAGPDGGGP